MSQLWQMEETSMFFACNYAVIVKGEHVWYIDSGCSNHMTAHESMLINLDKNVLTRIKMENGQLVQAIAKETLVIETKRGVKYIKEVMLVPGLDKPPKCGSNDASWLLSIV
ncbi:hypothetical protein ACFX11_019714 [Malus domestica]